MPDTTNPPMLTARQFDAVLARFGRIVGTDNVITADGGPPFDWYRNRWDVRFDTAEEIVASAAVKPASVQEVQEILAVANDAGVPVHVWSRGRAQP